jgi:hypothetical protein
LFTGSVTGWNADDMLDLADVDFSSATLTYTANADGTATLSVSDSVDTVTIILIGQPAGGEFLMAADATGGTAVSWS